MKSLRLFAYVSYPFSNFFHLKLFAALVCALTTAFAHGQEERISDGGFEQGGVGWRVQNENNSLATWLVSTVGTNAPVHGNPTSSNGGGQGQYVVSVQVGSADTAIYQDFFIPTPVGSVTLSFDMFVNDFSGVGDSLTSQYAQVDILSIDADPLTLDEGILFNAYIGTDGGPLPNDFTSYEFDITSFVQQGGQYRIRFLQRNNLFRDAFNQGVDNVSVTFVPEPSTVCLTGLGLAMLLSRRRRQRG